MYEKRRNAGKIPVKISSKIKVRLSSGGQNALVGMVCAEFVQRFVPDGVLLYVGDTAKKFAYFDRQSLGDLGVDLEPHGKIPDVVIHDVRRNWLFLVEAVTSHGPINAKRMKELQVIFADSSKTGICYCILRQECDEAIYHRHILGDGGVGSRYTRPYDPL